MTSDRTQGGREDHEGRGWLPLLAAGLLAAFTLLETAPALADRGRDDDRRRHERGWDGDRRDHDRRHWRHDDRRHEGRHHESRRHDRHRGHRDDVAVLRHGGIVYLPDRRIVRQGRVLVVHPHGHRGHRGFRPYVIEVPRHRNGISIGGIFIHLGN